jgi:hypothetical protein
VVPVTWTNEEEQRFASITVNDLLVLPPLTARRGLTRGLDAAWAVSGMDSCLDGRVSSTDQQQQL